MTSPAPDRVTTAASATGPLGVTGRHLVSDETRLAQRRRARATRLPALLRDAARLVWRAAPGLTLLSLVVQLGLAGLIGVQVLVGRVLLERVLALQGGAGVGVLVAPLAALTLLVVVARVAQVVQQQQQRVLTEVVSRASWDRLVDVTTTVTLERFDDPAFFQRLQRVQGNALTRPLQVVTSLVALVGGVAGVAALVVTLALLAPLLLPVTAVAAVPLLAVARRQSRLEFAFATRAAPRVRLRDYLRRGLVSREEAKEVRAYRTDPVLRSHHDLTEDAHVADLRDHVRRRTVLGLVGSVGSSLVGAAGLALLLVQVDAGQVALADAGAALFALVVFGRRLQGLVGGGSSLLESGVFLADFDDFARLAREEQTREAARPDGPPPRLPARVDVAGLRFRYPGADADVLHDVDLHLEPGEVVALVGENGSGKTTLAKVLAGLYRPTGGSVRWGDVDTAGWPPRVLRDQVAVVFQDFVRYELPVRANISLGRPEREVDEERVRDAARRAGAATFVEETPEGYGTVLGPQFASGRELSVGQWQRLALARALYRDAPLVVLDEPTAALDPRAEAALLASLRSVMAGRTVLLITHRFSSAREADRVYVLDRGRVVQDGTHEQLMAAGGTYAELYRLQEAAYLRQDRRGSPA